MYKKINNIGMRISQSILSETTFFNIIKNYWINIKMRLVRQVV